MRRRTFPAGFELSVNMSTAQALRLTMPPPALFRADCVTP